MAVLSCLFNVTSGDTAMSQATLSRRALEMHALIRNYLSSGITQREFCQREHLPRSTFQYWLKDYRKQPHSESVQPATGFLPLQVTRSGGTDFRCHLCFPNGVTLDFDGALEADFLAALIKAGNG